MCGQLSDVFCTLFECFERIKVIDKMALVDENGMTCFLELESTYLYLEFEKDVRIKEKFVFSHVKFAKLLTRTI